MKGWLRKLKGALGLGSIWGLLGTAVGTVAAVAVTILGGVPLLTSWLTWGLPLGFASFVLGTGFGGMLGLLERNRTLEELSPLRTGAWGVVVGAAFPLAHFCSRSARGCPGPKSPSPTHSWGWWRRAAVTASSRPGWREAPYGPPAGRHRSCRPDRWPDGRLKTPSMKPSLVPQQLEKTIRWFHDQPL